MRSSSDRCSFRKGSDDRGLATRSRPTPKRASTVAQSRIWRLWGFGPGVYALMSFGFDHACVVSLVDHRLSSAAWQGQRPPRLGPRYPPGARSLGPSPERMHVWTLTFRVASGLRSRRERVALDEAEARFLHPQPHAVQAGVHPERHRSARGGTGYRPHRRLRVLRSI